MVVGTLHEASGIRSLSKINRSKMLGIDLLEARLDSLPAKFIDSLPLSSLQPFPMIATARHPAEGGAGDLFPTKRRDLLERSLNWASAIDVELRSARAFAPLIATAHQNGRTVILSHHNFSSTPTLAAMNELARRASDLGADLLKVATFLRGPADLGRLIEFQSAKLQVPVTCMGMGPAGRFSRIVLSGFGAPLCYGWLGKQQVPGQWPALKLAGVLSEVLPV
jgi:3-dehydroquinate dehydratase-1